MKILQILPELNTGGVERGTIELSKALIEKGYRSYVISNGGVLVETLENQGGVHLQVQVTRKHLMTVLQLKKLRRIIVNMRPDVIHVRSRVPAWMIYVVMQTLPKSKQPVVVSTFHGMYSKPFYSQVMTFADHIISVSDTVTEYIVNAYNVDRKKITRIYRGCDSEQFQKRALSDAWKENWYRDYPQTRGKKLLTLPARITQWKGIDTMLELIAILDDEYHALIVGPVNFNKQRYWEALNSVIQAKKIQSRVTFTGFRNDMDNIFRLSTIVYNLSNQPEPFGRTVCEACHVGTRVIAWAAAGPRETLSELYPEGLVEPGDMQGLVNKTFELSQEGAPEPRANRFTTEATTAQTIALYENLLFAKANASNFVD